MSAKVMLYIACSLDGYIADEKGGISFLEETPSPVPDLGYEQFYNTIGALIMGGKTYRQVVTELSPDQWPYEGKDCFVYTKEPISNGNQIISTQLPPKQLLEHIRKTTTSDIWVVGGGQIIQLFLQENLIDQFIVYMMPTLLGGGIPLFPAGFPKTALQLQSVQQIGDIAEVIYTKR